MVKRCLFERITRHGLFYAVSIFDILLHQCRPEYTMVRSMFVRDAVLGLIGGYAGEKPVPFRRQP
jgi:hypothetical protein